MEKQVMKEVSTVRARKDRGNPYTLDINIYVLKRLIEDIDYFPRCYTSGELSNSEYNQCRIGNAISRLMAKNIILGSKEECSKVMIYTVTGLNHSL